MSFYPGVKAIVDTIRAKHPEAKVVLMPIFPRGKNSSDPRFIANEKANAVIRTYADGKDVILLDFNSKFLGAKEESRKILCPIAFIPTRRATGYGLMQLSLSFGSFLANSA